MNTSHMFTSKISMCPNNQQQSGQKSFDISFSPYLYHPLHVQGTPTAMFANNPFQRTFASVVSCKPPVHQKSNDIKSNNNKGLFNNNNKDGILNTFLKKIVYQKRSMLPPKIPYFEPSHVQKEFEDFKTLPSYLQNQRTASKSYSCTMQNPKHKHEKQRHSIEHDIRVDCDIFNVKKVNQNKQTPAMKLATENLPKKDTDENFSDPPFEIYSLEEFPAIPTVTSHTQQPNKPAVASTSSQNKADDSDESDFVKYQDDIAKVTPTFIPRRYNLCEKVSSLVKNSPKKFLNIPMMSPRRSCLKPSQRRRTFSECSDDFIVFDRSSCEENGTKEEDVDSDSDIEFADEDDESDISDEEDDGVIQDDVESDEDDECDGQNESASNEGKGNFESHQPDSGMEEKRVHFSLVPKVHVIIAWNYAYRQARRGDTWRQSAVDRERFANRIASCGEKINPVLDRNHRNRIFEERFQD